MVRTASAVLVLALAGCTSTTPMPDTTPATAQCHADAAQSLLGQPATPDTVERARRRGGAQVARVLKPDQMVTMEFREGRLNVYVDAANVITRIACG